MLLAEINDTGYNILLFLHIVAMFVAFAPAFVHPFLEMDTRGEPTTRQRIFTGVAKRGMRIYGVALIIGGLLGFGVSGLSKPPGGGDPVHPVSETWVLLSVILWVAMNGVLHALILPGEKAVAEGDESKVSRVALGGQIITVLFLITLYLMVFKPGSDFA